MKLESLLASIVSLRAHVPADALTASVLGTERQGQGVVIDANGTVLTIGYLITEAETIWLVDHEGRTAPGYPLGYDSETGFGLVQALQPMGWPPMEFGDSSEVQPLDPVMVAGYGGAEHVVDAQIISKREFAGYWEYVLDEAIFTRPAHPNWGGAALIGTNGKLLGIGSLLVQHAGEDGEASGANMIVPINLLKPILDDLRHYGRQNKPPRPWIGWLVQETSDHLVVAGIYDDCPAHSAGLKVGDVILEVDGQSVSGLAELFRRIWGLGEAGVTVPLTYVRNNATLSANIISIDRRKRLKSAAVH